MLGFAILVLVNGDRAYADCATEPEAAARERADLIATGTVESVDVRPESSRVEVSVERVFKGDSGETLYVTTDSGSLRVTSIDVRFEESSGYLLYLREDGGELTTSICDGTRELAGGSSRIPAGLGEGVSPENSGSGDSEAVETLPRTGGVALLDLPLVLASVVVTALILRRVRRAS